MTDRDALADRLDRLEDAIEEPTPSATEKQRRKVRAVLATRYGGGETSAVTDAERARILSHYERELRRGDA